MKNLQNVWMKREYYLAKIVDNIIVLVTVSKKRIGVKRWVIRFL